MAYKPHARQRTIKRVTVQFEGEPCWVDYRPAAVTPHMMRDLDALTNTHDKALKMVRTFITSWDVENGDGSRLAPTDPEVDDFEYGFLNAVIKGVMSDLYPDPTPAVNTGSFS